MYKKALNIPEKNSLKETKPSEWKTSGGQDTDIYWFDEMNGDNEVIAKYIIKNSTSKHPPFTTKITYEKFSPSGDFISTSEL